MLACLSRDREKCWFSCAVSKDRVRRSNIVALGLARIHLCITLSLFARYEYQYLNRIKFGILVVEMKKKKEMP